jgi:hypothetical protein
MFVTLVIAGERLAYDISLTSREVSFLLAPTTPAEVMCLEENITGLKRTKTHRMWMSVLILILGFECTALY